MAPVRFIACALLALLAIDENEEAAALLAKAEQQAADARYADARRTYERIAERYPETPAAETARRRSQPSAFVGWADILRHGPSANRVDLVLMGEGYTLDHQKAFDKLADDVPRLFERQPTFREYYPYFNFQRANLISADSGVDGFGREYDTALGSRTIQHVLADFFTHEQPHRFTRYGRNCGYVIHVAIDRHQITGRDP